METQLEESLKSQRAIYDEVHGAVDVEKGVSRQMLLKVARAWGEREEHLAERAKMRSAECEL